MKTCIKIKKKKTNYNKKPTALQINCKHDVQTCPNYYFLHIFVLLSAAMSLPVRPCESLEWVELKKANGQWQPCNPVFDCFSTCHWWNTQSPLSLCGGLQYSDSFSLMQSVQRNNVLKEYSAKIMLSLFFGIKNTSTSLSYTTNQKLFTIMSSNRNIFVNIFQIYVIQTLGYFW